jgi:hypothetical protein
LNKKTIIKYTAREFNSIKRELVDYAKKYYPETNKDFSESGFGSLLFDLVAYVGDSLSYSIDYAANESFLDTSLEFQNILKHSRSRGFKFTGPPTSYGVVSCFIIVPAATAGLGPDLRYLPFLRKGSEFSNAGGNNFILNETIDFSNSANEVIVAQVNATTGVPISYAIKASGQVLSGELIRETIELGNFSQFLRVELAASNIAEIISVTDSEGHEYYEVEFLSQNVVYRELPNFNSDRDKVSSILKPVVVPRRFVVERDRNTTVLQFGYGSNEEIRLNPIADPTGVALQLHGRDYFTDTSFDPSKMLQSDKFGVAPSNTMLTVVCRVNSGENVNAAAGSVTVVETPIFEFTNAAQLSNAIMADISNSLEVTNEEPIAGDVTTPTTTELKRRIYDTYASQNRAVTKQDYVSCVYQMPARFGAIKRAAISVDSDSFKRNLNLYLAAEDRDGTLVIANDTLKKNLKTWLENVKMINDTVDLLDATIINVGIEFECVVDEEQNRHSALSQATSLLADYYSACGDIGENFSISNVYALLKMVPNIVDVTDVKLVPKYGGSYSDATIDLDSRLSADGRLLYCPEGFVYEIKFPTSDIKGTIR